MRLARALAALALVLGPPIAAGAEASVARSFQLQEGVALHGFDPVGYFAGAAQPGDPARTATHEGVIYRFSSDAHREAFRADPARYVPAYGGWCAWAMLDGDRVDVDPRSFLVVEGRLLLFYKGLLGDTRAKWIERARREGGDARLLAIADQHWRAIASE